MRGVIYARFSSEKQNETSIEGQIRECTEYANFNDIEIVNTYIDRAFSARTANRSNFQKMIKDSYKNNFDCVIVWKLDRFARDRYDSAYYKNILKKNGVRVISAKETISQGADGILLESILEGLKHSNGHKNLKLELKQPNQCIKRSDVSSDLFLILPLEKGISLHKH